MSERGRFTGHSGWWCVRYEVDRIIDAIFNGRLHTLKWQGDHHNGYRSPSPKWKQLRRRAERRRDKVQLGLANPDLIPRTPERVGWWDY